MHCIEEVIFHNHLNGEIITIKVADRANVEGGAGVNDDFSKVKASLSYEIRIQRLGFVVSSIFAFISVILTTFFILKSSIPPFALHFDALFVGISFSFLVIFFFLAILKGKFLSGNPNILKLSPIIVSSVIRIQRYASIKLLAREAIFIICLYYFYFGNEKSQ